MSQEEQQMVMLLTAILQAGRHASNMGLHHSIINSLAEAQDIIDSVKKKAQEEEADDDET